MFISSCRSPVVAGILSVAIAVPPGATLYAQAKPAAAPQAKPPIAPPPVAPAPPVGTNADTGWPRTVALKSGSVVWYQPQVESWAEQTDPGLVGRVLSAKRREGTSARHHQDRGPTRRARRSRRDHGSQDHRVTSRHCRPIKSRRWWPTCRRFPERARHRPRSIARVCQQQPVDGEERRRHQGRPAEGVMGARTCHADQPRWRTDLESDQGSRSALRRQHELGSVRAHADQDALRALQRIVAAGDRRHRSVEGRR